MTTYYLKSQLTEKLGTDANLAEQIEILPQTEYSASSGEYFTTAPSYDGTAENIANAKYYGPVQKRYKYLSVKNTGTQRFILETAQIVVDITDNTSVSSVVTENTTIATGTTVVTQINFATSNLADLVTANALEAGGMDNMWFNCTQGTKGNYKVVNISTNAAPSTDSLIVLKDPGLGAISTLKDGALNVITQQFVDPGQTVVTRADGRFYDGDIFFPFTIAYDYSATGVLYPFNAQIFALRA